MTIPGPRSAFERRAVAQRDVLVAVAAIMLAGLLLFPGLARSQGQRAAATCTENLRRFGQGLHDYAAEHGGYIPGVNTSGFAVSAKRLNWQNGTLNDPHVPVQSFDWMTPVVDYFVELPEVRADRWHALWTQFGCPWQRETSDIYPGGSAPDTEAFAQYDWPACSYLMPAFFSYWGESHRDERLGSYEGFPSIPVYARTAPTNWEVRSPTFGGRLEQTGPAARKLFVADGTRYVDASHLIDFDISPDPTCFGAFSANGAWYPGDNASGVRSGSLNWSGDAVPEGSVSGGWNLRVSYRHRVALDSARAETAATGEWDGTAQQNDGSISGLFFDGHVRYLNDRASRAVELWYPSGCVVRQPVGMTTLTDGYVVP